MACTRIQNFDVRVRGGPLKISKRNSCVAQWISLVHPRLYFLPQLPRTLDTAACAFRTCCRFLNISMLSSAVRRQLPTALDERDAFQFRYSLGVEARDLGVAEAARKWIQIFKT
eukprot:g33272.t1